MNTDETTCPDCAETIKAAARVCKHCGWRREVDSTGSPPTNIVAVASAAEWKEPPVGKDQPPLRWTIGKAVGGLAMSGALIGILYLSQMRQFEAHSGHDYSLESKARTYMAAQLRDPTSAEFRSLETLNGCVVGEINAKNGFGGYEGFRAFYYNSKSDTGAIKPDDVKIDLDDSSTIAAYTKSTNYLDGHTACVSPRAR